MRGAIGAGVDAIVNLAAETHVDRSILDPEAFLRTDILGTHVLLEAVRAHGVARFVQVSTDEVYGDVAEGASAEDSPVAPRSPYAASKAGADLQVLAYGVTYGAPVIVTRGSNTYGPHQFPEKLIPLFVTNLIDGEPVPLYGDGLNVRDWLHVEDHARGILHALEHGAPGNVYNLGGGNLRTNREITQRLVALCGRAWESHVRHVTDRPGHDRRYALDEVRRRTCARLAAAPHLRRRPRKHGPLVPRERCVVAAAEGRRVQGILRAPVCRARPGVKGIILAGGLGTRLRPLTKVTNKHLLPVYDKPMIYYPLETLCRAGIRDIMVVTGGNSAGDFLRLLGNGSDFGLKDIYYTYQEGEGGIAAALRLCEHFAEGERVCVVLGDNILEDDIGPSVAAFARQASGARLLLKEVRDPERFGVPAFDGKRIVRIDEKPAVAASSFAVTGVYLYDARVFEYIGGLQALGPR